MPHTTKKQRREDDRQSKVAADNDVSVGFDNLGVDEIANVLGFLDIKDIMSKRRINKKTREAVKMTIVPLIRVKTFNRYSTRGFCVGSVDEYNAMNVMTRALPNLQQIEIGRFGIEHKYNDGEDPDEQWAAETADMTTHDIEIISNFRKLRILEICSKGLNGRYPVLFNSFPLLQKLSICQCRFLKWDLEVLAAFPLLKELKCEHNNHLTGNINSLSLLKDTLEKVTIMSSRDVTGNFMDLADFPHLKELNLVGSTSVTGDVRDIGENDFSSLELLYLPKSVYGGNQYELQRIADAPDLIRALYLLKKQRPSLSMLAGWSGVLSRGSPEWYEPVDFNGNYILLTVHFVKAGPRIGYQWQTNGHCCEVNWLDPEPDKDSSIYGKYIKKLRKTEKKQKVDIFTGLHEPPTEEEYNRLLAEYDDGSSDGSEEYDSEDEYIWEYNASDDDW
jgi:hypothetical protein